jgi:hypothetical protein
MGTTNAEMATIVDGIKFSGAIIAFVSLDPLIFHLYGISEKPKKKEFNIYQKYLTTKSTGN